MANTYTASTDLNTLPVYYHKVFLERLVPGPIMMQYCIEKPLENGAGTSIKFPRLVTPSLTVSAYKLTQGTVISTEKVVDQQVSAVIEQFGNSQAVWDLTELTAIDGTVQEAVKALADQANNIIDRRIIQEAYGTSATPTGAGFSCFAFNTAGAADLDASTSAFGTYVGTTEFRMKAATVRAAVKKLKGRNVVPQDDGFYALVCHTDTAFRLQADTEWQTAYSYTDPENIRKGVAGVYAGAKIQIDNNISTSANGSAGATLYYSLLLGRGAMGATKLDGGVKTYFKRSGEQDTFNPINQFIAVGWKANFVPVRLNLSCGLVVITAD